MNKMKNKKILLTIMWIIIIFLFFTIIINCYMVLSSKGKIVDFNNINDNYDAILILGCKVDGDEPSLMLSKRLEKGIELYNKYHFKIIISGDNTRLDYHEVDVMNNYLINHGIDSNDIIIDNAGINTYDSIYRVKNVFNINKVIIVTQEYHMYRAIYIADRLNLDVVGVVADNIPQKLIMLKNKIREVLSRDKNFFKVLVNPQSKYLMENVVNY